MLQRHLATTYDDGRSLDCRLLTSPNYVTALRGSGGVTCSVAVAVGIVEIILRAAVSIISHNAVIALGSEAVWLSLLTTLSNKKSNPCLSLQTSSIVCKSKTGSAMMITNIKSQVEHRSGSMYISPAT